MSNGLVANFSHVGFTVFSNQNFIMNSHFNTAEARWLAQFASMRDAISQSKLEQSNGVSQQYGHDISIEDSALLESNANDIWSVFSKDENGGKDSSYCSDEPEEVEPRVNHENSGFSLEWLRRKCSALAINRRSGLDAGQLEDQLLAMLASDMQSTFLSSSDN